MIISDDPPAPFDPGSVDSWLEWFVGTPLRLLLTLTVGLVVLFVLRRLIKTVSDHIADGTLMNRRGLRELGAADLGPAFLRPSPVVAARRMQRARTIGSVLRSTTTLVVGAIVVLMMLSDIGVNIMPLVASAGVVGVALGFGAQSLVKDFLSGTFMLLEDQYGVGDTVTFGAVSGTIEAVALRVTKVRDIDGTLWYIRNGEITSVGNRTQGWARAVVDVHLRFDTNIGEVRRLLERAGETVKNDPVIGTYLQEDPEVIGIEALTAESVLMKVRAKTDPAMQWSVARALREAVREELEAAGVSLAASQQTVLINKRESAETTATQPSSSGSSGSSGTAVPVASQVDGSVGATPTPVEEATDVQRH
ncbi:mechanosensitive ion channel family protein [Sanguibacter antarcticus]|uniref:Small conductance mechanosensitive channel n=1 Tax=Sanguibacter antarcticus TaxID=372484 RepID=A0A2A9E5I4_9MICO|nr:mechanosensitive ion channel family protein [Sanguibacter antarcticus]PFG33625.1 small conductance mechanosensitive channel [Sanguibacter antarcticus]